MATLRSVGRLVPNLNRCLINKNPPYNIYVRCALISTSKKSKVEDHRWVGKTIVEGEAESIDRDPNVTPEVPKNWVSYGYSDTNIIEDNTYMHIISFLTITVCMVCTAFIWIYLPDNRMAHWYQREAFLELRRREAEGLPLVDKNLVPLDKIELPSDEELGDIEIII